MDCTEGDYESKISFFYFFFFFFLIIPSLPIPSLLIQFAFPDPVSSSAHLFSSFLLDFLLPTILESYTVSSSASSGVGIGAKRPGLVPNRPGSYGTSGMHGQRGERQASTMISVDQVDIGMRQKAGKLISLSLLSSSLLFMFTACSSSINYSFLYSYLSSCTPMHHQLLPSPPLPFSPHYCLSFHGLSMYIIFP